MTPQFGFITLSRQVHDRLVDHAAEAQSRTPPSCAAPRSGASPARSRASLMVMKGLPLAYSKDMQEDKEVDLRRPRQPAAGHRRDDRHGRGPASRMPEAMRAAAGSGYSTATDLADWLVRELKMPFREAHHVTGSIVAAAEKRGRRPGQAAARRHAGRRAAHHESRIFGAQRRKLGGQPDQLWGNCATERRQNGASLGQAVGKGARDGLSAS